MHLVSDFQGLLHGANSIMAWRPVALHPVLLNSVASWAMKIGFAASGPVVLGPDALGLVQLHRS